ncbi:PcfJ domain-containing protein [Parabacteroides faecis]|uniref:PcfJ domain-containing protein n=1 Tax=Parabacteroides TaxID=375288 RepID=UPI000EFE5E3C|nr:MULTISPECIES: PcfJ domain-containing protein [Parabacteroides]MBC8618935.1 PcfJ domain-containing protein [Parabacteroides faecis]RHS00058.1 hypothetical protein DWW23_05295 [Parabacteroides sp. AF14-59]
MKPRNKQQRLVASLSSKLPKLTDKQRQWAMKNAVEHPGFRTKKGIICTDCGNSFTDMMKFEDGEFDICPHCGACIKIETSRRKTDREIEYFSIVTTCKGWQVIRFFYIEKNCKAGKSAYYYIDEVIQQWMKPDNELVTIAKPRLMNSAYISDMWSHGGKLEIRNYQDVYNVSVNETYPIMRVLPEWKKLGFTKAIPHIGVFSLLRKLLYEPKVETLLKAKQYDLLRFIVGFSGAYKVHNNWPSIKICFRNNYIVKDASMWFDYLDLLKRYHKDLRNAHYVCPKDLSVAHDYYMNKRRKEQEREAKERDMQKLLQLKKYEKEFEELKSKFFDLNISDGKIVIVVLKSLDDFKQEGDAMHHCVFTNEYFKKKDSLILSARINDKRIETIEVSLKKMEIVQSRGVCNKNTEYHDRIIALVKKNMNLIRRKLTA